jgi:RNA polymerase sigma factor (TIGR02999 family)
MSVADENEITLLLRRAAEGDSHALDRLFDSVYAELKRIAHFKRVGWTEDQTLNTTAIVHEAYVKLFGGRGVAWSDRGHFYALASRAMRQVLVSYAERRLAEKRGGGLELVPLDVANPVAPEAAEEIIALHEALGRLAELDERQSRIVEYRFFVGLPVQETADLLGLSPATVKRDWATAIAWLRREMSSPRAEAST